MGFSISCSQFQTLERTYATGDFATQLRHRVREVALEHAVDPLHASAKQAGASPALLADIGVFDEPDGSVLVGVPDGGPSSREAFDLEYGTAVGAPHGWLRTTIAEHRRDIEHALARIVIDLVKYGPK